MTVTNAGQPPPQTKKRGGCGRTLGCGCLLLILLLALVVGGGYWAYTSGAISPWQVYKLSQPKPLTINLDNLRDDTLYVTVTFLDSEDDPPFSYDRDLAAFDVRVTYLQKAGRYRIDFGTQSGGADLGACNLSAAAGERYQFIALPDKIVVNRASQPSQVGADYVLSTCSFCR
jgi:hypothetical protein